ncbi:MULTISPECIES: response regulator [unclassified Arenibacter]|uniref:response regulator n=1 Tax=unclassified Arenibacter TaxID=2615047 RepID=UPI000E344F37|nr:MULTISPECIES: response regulator [unclassified Arenibacter]MCM4162812.1 response regulator [Arenibacter sp. A80]RFT56865.1 response regulator [Arenibacter sp. P308M17]
MELKVCIIDDDLVSQFASRYCIEQSISNCRTIVCDTAEEVLNMFAPPVIDKEDVPDLIFLDLVMNGMDGWEFLDTIKIGSNVLQKTDIYILSAFSNSKDRTRAKEHPMIKGHFDKPLSKSIMEKILHSKK